MRLRNSPQERENQGEGVFGGGSNDRRRRVDDDDATATSRLDVHVVDANASSSDHPEPSRPGDRFRRDSGLAADDNRVKSVEVVRVSHRTRCRGKVDIGAFL